MTTWDFFERLQRLVWRDEAQCCHRCLRPMAWDPARDEFVCGEHDLGLPPGRWEEHWHRPGHVLWDYDSLDLPPAEPSGDPELDEWRAELDEDPLQMACHLEETGDLRPAW